MLVKTEALVLHSLKIADQRMIVDMFTREQGRLSFVVHIPKTSRGRLKKQYFQPLTLLTVEADMRQQQPLQRMRDAMLLSPFTSLYTEPRKLSIALFVAEFLCHALRGEQQNVSLFDYLRSSVQWLEGSESRYANFHLVFLLRLSRFLGFYPNLDDYHRGDLFDLREGRFTSQLPPHRDFLDATEASHMQTVMRMDFATMHLFRLSQSDRRRLLTVLMNYYRLHLPAFPELHSLPVLYQLFE